MSCSFLKIVTKMTVLRVKSTFFWYSAILCFALNAAVHYTMTMWPGQQLEKLILLEKKPTSDIKSPYAQPHRLVTGEEITEDWAWNYSCGRLYHHNNNLCRTARDPWIVGLCVHIVCIEFTLFHQSYKKSTNEAGNYSDARDRMHADTAPYQHLPYTSTWFVGLHRRHLFRIYLVHVTCKRISTIRVQTVSQKRKKEKETRTKKNWAHWIDLISTILRIDI